MKRALISPGADRVFQVVARGTEFPVHSSLMWRDCADDVTPDTHLWNGAAFVLKPVPPPPPDLSNVDNLDKAFRALALLMRQYCNALQAGTYTQKTIAQMKADFKTIWDALP